MHLKKYLFFLFFLFFSHSTVFPSFASEKNTSLYVEPTNINYYLATLIGEDEHYAPTFYNDFIIKSGDQKIMHFTKINNKMADCFFYISSDDEIKNTEKLFELNANTLNKISPRILPAFNSYKNFKPSYQKKSLYGKISEIILKEANIDIAPLIEKYPKEKLDNTIYRYFVSNHIENYNDITKDKQLLNLVADKFFMLCTTCFYRDWAQIQAFKDYLGPIKEKAKEENRPIKIKVFACSTGEEAISYAIEMLEAGITNFTILASDINESSIAFAKQFRYSDSSFQRSSLKTQEKLRKYFELNEKLNIWEPKDKKLFASHIKYIKLDILKYMPLNLEKDFAPPYDIISILNVLLYLHDSAIQNKKDYWLNLLNTNGILVLHDQKYSLLKRKFGDKWSFDNFFIVNEWVNVKMSADKKSSEKTELAEKLYNIDDETTFIRLNQAYTQNHDEHKALKLCEEYLKKYPFSYNGLFLALEHYIKFEKSEKVKDMIITLLHTYVYPEKMLTPLISLEKSSSEKKYLTALKKACSNFIDKYQTAPETYENYLDSLEITSEKWDTMRLLLKLSALTSIQKYYLQHKELKKAEAITAKAVELSKKILNRDKEYLVVSMFLDQISRELVKKYTAKKDYEKIFALSENITKILKNKFANKPFHYIFDGIGFLNLQKAEILDIQEKYDDIYKQTIDTAIENYKLALPYKDNFGMSRIRMLYGEIGHSYFLRGKYYLANGAQKDAEKDLITASNYFEKGLDIDPVYGGAILKERRKLEKIAKNLSISSIIGEINE